MSIGIHFHGHGKVNVGGEWVRSVRKASYAAIEIEKVIEDKERYENEIFTLFTNMETVKKIAKCMEKLIKEGGEG